jgi:hypothetical protein
MTPNAIAAFVASRFGLPTDRVGVSVERLHGGLESTVVRAALTGHTCVPATVIVKEMCGHNRRETAVYGSVAELLDSASISSIWGAQPHGDVEYLYLEDLGPVLSWPWGDLRAAAEVCRTLARLHRMPVNSTALGDWNYESGLAASAEQTLKVATIAADPCSMQRQTPRP